MTPTARVCRVFPYTEADGPLNMASDEALLELVARAPAAAAAAFRTYGWTEPTLSLGYFQAYADLEADPRWEGVPVVRRPTGGGAIWHDREVTYALALPADHPLARRNTSVYRAVHAAIAALLGRLGVVAQRRGEARAAGPGEVRPFLCFLDRDAEDLTIGPAKIVGSAQRRRAGSILQHGSILLRRSPATPELPGVADLSACPADPRHWTAWLDVTIPGSLGMRPEPSDWPADLLARAQELADTVYRSDARTRRR